VLELNLPESSTSSSLKAIQPPTCRNHNATGKKAVKFNRTTQYKLRAK
jgi:hypothetical protein